MKKKQGASNGGSKKKHNKSVRSKSKYKDKVLILQNTKPNCLFHRHDDQDTIAHEKQKARNILKDIRGTDA